MARSSAVLPGPGGGPSNVSTVPSRSKRTTGVVTLLLLAVAALVVALTARVLRHVCGHLVDRGRGHAWPGAAHPRGAIDVPPLRGRRVFARFARRWREGRRLGLLAGVLGCRAAPVRRRPLRPPRVGPSG